MSQPLKSIVNTVVFIRFHFFNIFVILMTSGASWDLILVTLDGLGAPFLWFSGVLDMYWNFIDFQDHPKLRGSTWLMVNWCTRASSNKSILPACWPLDYQTPVCWPADYQIVIADGMLEEYLKYDTWYINEWKNNIDLWLNTAFFAAWWPLAGRGRRIYIYI